MTTQAYGKNKMVFIIIAIAIFAGLGTSIYFTVKNVFVPVSQEVLTKTNNDIVVIVRKENFILIPLSNFFWPRDTNVYVDIFYRNLNLTLDNFKPPLLSSNSSSILSLPTAISSSKATSASWVISMKVGHPLNIGNYTQKNDVLIFYRPGNISQKSHFLTPQSTSSPDMLGNKTTYCNLTSQSSLEAACNFPIEPKGAGNQKDLQSALSNIREMVIPVEFNIKALDFNSIEYFWIIALGVLASRVFSIGKESLTKPSINFGYEELIWVPFSAIITLLIFSGFFNQVKLTSDLFLNLSIAFGFGFGFDKILESWRLGHQVAEKGAGN